MARRTGTITHLRYWKRHARGANKAMDVSALPDGRDLLTFAMAVWNGLDDDNLMDPARFRYCRPRRDETIARGRTLTLVADVGTFGDRASLRHSITAAEVLQHDGDLSHTVPVRVTLLVPMSATSALLFIEHAAEGTLGGPFLAALKTAWAAAYADYTLEAETLVRPEAWIANAQLQEVQAVGWGSADLADAGTPRVVGRVKSVLTPEKGAGYLPLRLLERLQSGVLSPASLLGLADEPDEVRVTLTDGDQQRTFVIGHERTPPIRVVITDHGSRAPTTDGFRKWALAEAPSHFQPVGVKWNTSWKNGSWKPKDLTAKVVPPRE